MSVCETRSERFIPLSYDFSVAFWPLPLIIYADAVNETANSVKV